MQDGDEVFVGVGDIEIKAIGGWADSDALKMQVKDGQLRVDYPGGTGDEHVIIAPGSSEPSQLRLHVEENGSNIHVNALPMPGNVVEVQIDKTCPGQ